MIPTISLGEPVGPSGAPLLVLGPSLGTSTSVWDDAARILRSHFRVAAWDLPGHGHSSPATVPFTVGELADAVIDALDKLGEQTCFSAGVSLGGAVGLELALRHRDRISGLSVVCSGAVIGTPEGWRERAVVARTAGTASLIPASAQRWFATGSRLLRAEATEKLLASLADVDDESYALCCEALALYDVRDQLADLRLPVQAAWAEYDTVAPLPNAQAIVDRVQDGILVEVKGAGHLAPAERPQDVAALIQSFFGSMAVAA